VTKLVRHRAEVDVVERFFEDPDGFEAFDAEEEWKRNLLGRKYGLNSN